MLANITGGDEWDIAKASPFTTLFQTIYFQLYPSLRFSRKSDGKNPLISIDVSRPGEKMTWPGSGGLSMIGECRWVLQCFPYRHWTSSPPLKAGAAASPGTSCTEPQFSGQATVCRRERGDKMR